MSRGRPRATYADNHIEQARATPGQWSVLPSETPSVDRVVRKIRREGLEAKYLVLDELQALVAVRSKNDGTEPSDEDLH